MRAVVTGGTGFLGSRLVALLRESGHEVRAVARGRHAAAAVPGVPVTHCDVRDTAALEKVFAGCDVVFHTAARTGLWGNRREFYDANVGGTASVISALRRAGVPRLVYTSTPSVIGYGRDIENGPRDLAYAPHHESPYAASKCQAEQAVLAANAPELATVALRPHLIFGPNDLAMLPRVVRRAMRGGLSIVGDGRNRVDLTYIDNAAWAHIDAARALCDHRSPCAGKAYFISNGEPVLLWEWLGALLEGLGVEPPRRVVSHRTARRAGALCELLWRALHLPGEPPVHRFLVDALARSHWYDPAPAQRTLGYRARVGMEEATRLTIEWLVREQRQAH